MIASTLLANGAKVYIVGLDKDEVERIAKNYNGLLTGEGKEGEMVGLQGDCSNKVRLLHFFERGEAVVETVLTVLFLAPLFFFVAG